MVFIEDPGLVNQVLGYVVVSVDIINEESVRR